MTASGASPAQPEGLPDSGDGVRTPDPASLPHPALWSDPPPARAPRAFDDLAEEHAAVPRRTPARMATIWGATAVVVAAAVVLGFAFVQSSLALAVTGLLVGAAGVVVLLSAGVLKDVSVGQSPLGPG